MSYNKINQSHSSSYDELLFLSNEKVPKVKIPCSYSNEGDLYWLEDSPLTWIKAGLLDTALTSYQNFSRDREPPENLTSSEFKAFKRLSKNKDIIIQKADKGNTVVILDKCSDISVIEEILNDNSKFSKLDIPAGKEINHIVNLEKRITSELHLQQLMNLLSLIHFILLKKLVNRIPTYTWLVWTLILYLLIFP